jgi:hypothetical protein
MKLPLFAIVLTALSAITQAAEVKPLTPFACPFSGPVTKKVDYEVRMVIYNELVRTY